MFFGVRTLIRATKKVLEGLGKPWVQVLRAGLGCKVLGVEPEVYGLGIRASKCQASSVQGFGLRAYVRSVFPTAIAPQHEIQRAVVYLQ